MTRRTLLAGALAQRETRPNVIILLTDDQGHGDFSAHGNPVLKTPAMDRLHDESVRFTSFHVAPMCTPTRGQLMSGMDALRNGATSVTAGRGMLRRGIPTLAEAFAASGYRTGIFGKWHLGDNYPYRPMDRGFQEAKYHLGWGLQSAPEFTNDYFDGNYRDKGVVKKFDGYCTDFWFREAMQWMKGSEPFFCYLPTNAPHGPAWVEAKYSAPYDKPGLPASFFGMIANLDENLAMLEAFLKSSGLRENTIFIFMTDNGATGGFQVWNSGMRGRKTQIYEGGHRVPCFVRWPAGELRAPREIAAPAQIQDLFPTLVDLCGLKTQAKFDGVSLAGVLKGTARALPERMLVVQYGQILKKWDACTIWNQWRLVGENELYNLDRDPAQKQNAAAEEPHLLARMRAHYEQWWAGVEPRLRDFAPISIGAEAENPVALSSSDWEEIYCDNVQAVSTAQGGPRGGPWNIFVERAGEYEIKLCRWPEELKLPLSAACPARKKRVATVAAGLALPVAKVQLRIAGQDLSRPVSDRDVAAVFRVKLARAEKTQLHAWFQDKDGKDLSGAFYAYVRRV